MGPYESVDRGPVKNGVIIIGSSGAGKTTLLNTLKRTELARLGLLNFPTRFITRPPRDNDDFDENRHVSVGRFHEAVAGGEILLRWRRAIGPRRTEWYGFSPPPASGLAVYSANNALLDQAAEVRPARLLKDALIVGLYAHDDIRERRLRTRSPGMMSNLEEARHRLEDPARGVLGQAAIAINTSGGDPEIWSQLVVDCLASYCAATSESGFFSRTAPGKNWRNPVSPPARHQAMA